MSNKDVYSDFNELKSKEVIGVDYEIELLKRENSKIAIIAPHGGGIEPKTTNIARLIAGENFSFYSFKGIKSTGNRRLHITSHNFDEPTCIDLVANSDLVVAIHGCSQQGNQILLGGRDEDLKLDIEKALSAAKFNVLVSNHEFPGANPRNICNRSKRALGVHFELTKSFRESENLHEFIGVVRNVLLENETVV